MRAAIIVDTGPLVALVNASERHHAWARAAFSQVDAPVLTCEPVITEACFLLRRTPRGAHAVLELVERGAMSVGLSLERETPAVRRLLARYANVPMSLADACLVRMTELHSRAALMTLDSDFRIYRRNGRQAIPLITPA